MTTSWAAGTGANTGGGFEAVFEAANGAAGAAGVSGVTGATGITGAAAVGAEAARLLGAAARGAVAALGAEAAATGALAEDWGLAAIKGLSPTRSFFQMVDSSDGEVRPPYNKATATLLLNKSAAATPAHFIRIRHGLGSEDVPSPCLSESSSKPSLAAGS